MTASSILTDLKTKIGTEIHVGPWLAITQERIDQFAEATGDFQWIHVDVERARKESRYGGTIAHGFLTVSLIPYLTESVNPDKPSIAGVKTVVNYGSNKVRFPYPVKAGMNIRARTVLADVQEIKGGLQVIKKVTIEIDGVNKPACVAETVARYYF